MPDTTNQQEAVKEYKEVLENLRTRLSVLNTSIFLLEENLSDPDYKTNKYIRKINNELQRIREMIIELPDSNLDKD